MIASVSGSSVICSTDSSVLIDDVLFSTNSSLFAISCDGSSVDVSSLAISCTCSSTTSSIASSITGCSNTVSSVTTSSFAVSSVTVSSATTSSTIGSSSMISSTTCSSSPTFLPVSSSITDSAVDVTSSVVSSTVFGSAVCTGLTTACSPGTDFALIRFNNSSKPGSDACGVDTGFSSFSAGIEFSNCVSKSSTERSSVVFAFLDSGVCVTIFFSSDFLSCFSDNWFNNSSTDISIVFTSVSSLSNAPASDSSS